MAHKEGDDIETAFQRIQDGTNLDEEGKHWDAAKEFDEAQAILRKLSAAETTTQKVATLYSTQAKEFHGKAKTTFIKALQSEIDEGESSTENLEELTDEDANKRNALFASLFSRQIASTTESQGGGGEAEGDKPSVESMQKSLEERLSDLNASMPSAFKTPEERLADIKKGLKGLGVASHFLSESSSNKPTVQAPMTQEEQIAEIMEQARDEAKIERPGDKKDTVDEADHDDDSLLSDDDTEALSDEEEDELDDDEAVPIDAPKVRRYIVKAQAQLAQLVAMLDSLPDEEEAEIDDDGEVVYKLEVGRGQKLLSTSLECVKKASTLWNEGSRQVEKDKEEKPSD